MKELSASASASVGASAERCVAFLAEVGEYPSWYPSVVRTASVLERDGSGVPTLALADVHLALGPISHDLGLLLAVAVDPAREVRLTRATSDASDASDGERFSLVWRASDGSPTVLQLELSASVDVPRFAPVGALGGPFAQGFVDAAARALQS
jgi:hypothetical protein